MNESIKKDLTCTMCGDVKETYSEIVYSQSDRVCVDCKEETIEGDKFGFDRDMSRRISGIFEG